MTPVAIGATPVEDSALRLQVEPLGRLIGVTPVAVGATPFEDSALRLQVQPLAALIGVTPVADSALQLHEVILVVLQRTNCAM